MSQSVSQRTSRYRWIFLGFAAGGLTVHSFDLMSMQVLLISGSRIVALIVSVALIIALIVLTVRMGRKEYASSDKLWHKLLHMAVPVVPLLIVAAIVTDWWIGASIRVGLHLNDALPPGNLLVAGGRAGWVYLGLIVLLLAMVFYDKIAGKLQVFKRFVPKGMHLPSLKKRKAETVYPSR